jgi:hypothetical protein
MNETHYKNKYRIDSARLADYDYGSNGIYLVTICTQQKEHFFGNIVETGPNWPTGDNILAGHPRALSVCIPG